MSEPLVEQSTVSPTFDLKVGDKTIEVKMVFGRLNRVCKLVGNMADVQRLMLDPEMGSSVMEELLSTKKVRVDLDEMDISSDEAAKLLAWAGAHVLDFFIKLGSNFNKTSAPLIEGMAKVMDDMTATNDRLEKAQTSLADGSTA